MPLLPLPVETGVPYVEFVGTSFVTRPASLGRAVCICQTESRLICAQRGWKVCLSGDGLGGIKESAWQGSVGFICFGPLACLLAWADGRTCALIVSGLVISSLHASVVPLHFSFGWLNQFYILCCCL